METNLIKTNSDGDLSNGHLALPFNEKQFGDFLVSLLGKPQTISKKFLGAFCIDKDSLVDLFHIIEQRIHQQNDAKLINFRALISYNDNSTVELSGFEHLVNFNEPLPLVPKAIDLTWQYLIKFKDKEIPEKQEITVSFHVGVGSHRLQDHHFFDFMYFRNTISLRIAHTARTWGADIEGLLTKHIQVLCKSPKGYQKFLYNDSETINKIVQILLFLTSLISAVLWINQKKISLIFFLFVGTYLFSLIVDLILQNIEPSEDPSFILLTKESYNDKVAVLKRHKSLWIKFFSTILLSLIVSIVANYIYAYISNR